MADMAPPLTKAQLRKLVKDPDFWTYLYIGQEADPGWDNAKTAYQFLPALRVVLVKKAALAGDWAEDGDAGLCFNNVEKVVQRLDAVQASDLKTVLLAIAEAMKDREDA